MFTIGREEDSSIGAWQKTRDFISMKMVLTVAFALKKTMQ